VILADPTGTYGVRRCVDGVVIVAAGQVVTEVEEDHYSITFNDPDGLFGMYEAWVEITSASTTYRLHKFIRTTGSSDNAETIDSAALVLAEILREMGYASNPIEINAGDDQAMFTWPIAIRATQDIPDEFITAYDSGGVVDMITYDENNKRVIVEHCDVQLRVRGKRDDYMGAKSKARSLKEILTNIRNYEISISSEIENEPPEMYRVNVVTPLSKEAFIGNDDKGRPMFTVNFRTSINKVPA
jgi:hypothetical protein